MHRGQALQSTADRGLQLPEVSRRRGTQCRVRYSSVRRRRQPRATQRFYDRAHLHGGEKALGEKALGEKAWGEKALGEKAWGEKAWGEKAWGEKAWGEKAWGEKAWGEKALSSADGRGSATRRWPHVEPAAAAAALL
eukprot:COSAG01_NODE_3923_length_5530_cov_16.244338_2_plen_137_part_00